MTVFKAYLGILKHYWIIILVITGMLLLYGALVYQNNSGADAYVRERPSIHIVNHDQGDKISDGLVRHLKKTCDVPTVRGGRNGLDDALFYGAVSLIIDIPDGYGKRLLDGEDPELRVRTGGSSYSGLAEVQMERYIRAVKSYSKLSSDEDTVLKNVRRSLSKSTDVHFASNAEMDEDRVSRAASFYDFSSFTFLFAEIYLIGLILFIFDQDKIRSRMLVSPLPYRRFRRQLLQNSTLLALLLWAASNVEAAILFRDIMLSSSGLLFLLNSLLFALCGLSLAFLVASISKSRNAIVGWMNVIALGSSFLCGAFVPTDLLPSQVVKFAHVLPSYWYVDTDHLILKANNAGSAAGGESGMAGWLSAVTGIDGSIMMSILRNTLIILCFLFIFFLISQLLAARTERGRRE
ncbi:MAG: ABC transporter permease [Anaerovoracaceae bacterium]|jgi:ABC-2 type transport system permease protein